MLFQIIYQSWFESERDVTVGRTACWASQVAYRWGSCPPNSIHRVHGTQRLCAQPARKLVDVVVQVLVLDVVECSVVSAPHPGPERFQPTDAHLSPDTLSITVAYGMMVLQVIINPVLIGEFLRFGVH